MVEFNEECDLCDIWKIRDPIEKLFTFRQNRSSGIISRRLDSIFLSDKLQEIFAKTIILPALKTDHSFVSVIISNYN